MYILPTYYLYCQQNAVNYVITIILRQWVILNLIALITHLRSKDSVELVLVETS